jgi:hypothetical protein
VFDLIVQAMTAWNQLGLLAGAALFGGIGGILLGNRIYWRLRATRVSGTIIGVRTTANDSHYPVYTYTLPTGETAEATSNAGSNRTGGMQTGRVVQLLVFEEDPDKVADADSPVTEILGIILLGVGVCLGYVAATSWPVTKTTWLVLAAMILYGAYRLRARILSSSERPTLAAWRQKKREEMRALPVRPIEEILDAGAIGNSGPGARQKVSPALPLMFAAVAVVALFIAAYTSHRLLKLQSTGQRAPGVVVQLLAESDSDGDTVYHPLVSFEPREGASIEFRDSIGTSPPAYSPGEAVTVLYLPQSPRDSATIDRGAWNWAVPVGVLLFGGVFAAVAFFTSRALSSSPRSARHTP